MHANSNSGQTTALNMVERNSQAGIKRQIPGHVERMNTQQEQHLPGYSLSGFSKYAILTCLALLSIAVILLTGASYLGDGLSRAGHSPSEDKLEIVVANQVLNVSANTVRFPGQRRAGTHRRLDLYLHWPSLSGYKDDLKADFNDANNNSSLVFMTFEPRSMSYDMSGRLKRIYSVFFNGIAILDENGLVRQPLSETGGFIDEDIYYQPDSPYPFVARCVREASNIGAPFCIRDIHVGRELMVTYRFHKQLLNQWIELDDAVRSHASSLLVNNNLALAN